VNQGSAAISDHKGAVFLQSGPATSGENLRCQVKAYPGASFTVEMAFMYNTWANSGNAHCGLCIRDSGSGKIVAFGAGGSATALDAVGCNYSSATAYASAVTGWPSSRHCYDSSLIFLKYADNLSTTRTVSFSHDGINWTQMLSISRTDYLTPNQIGIFVNSASGYSVSNGQLESGMTVLSWRQY
jgi:hypothetical protein